MVRYIFVFTLLITFNFNFMAQDRLTGLPFATRSEVIAQNGMACTSQPLASMVAIDCRVNC